MRSFSPSALKYWAPLPLRLVVGYGFLVHGYAKLMRGPDVFIGILASLHVPMPHLLGWATVLLELFGGIAVLAGAFVVPVGVPLAIVLIVAIFTVHLPFGFSAVKLQAVTEGGPQFGKPGYEANLLYLACLATLMIGGAGPWSIDGKRRGASANRENESGTGAQSAQD